MKISANHLSIKSLEKTYQQISPRVQKSEEAKPNARYGKISKLKGFKKNKVMQPSDILSREEKVTLKRLFEYDRAFNFYGKANAQKALSGMLLDITG